MDTSGLPVDALVAEEEGPLLVEDDAPEVRRSRRWVLVGAALVFSGLALLAAAKSAPRSIAAVEENDAFLMAATASFHMEATSHAPTTDIVSRLSTENTPRMTLSRGVVQAAGGTCSWEGENCINTTCCRRTGFKCWERDAGIWASCSEDCNDLKKLGGTWSCKVLGGDRGAFNLEPQKEELKYQSLFCFMVVTPEGVVPPGVEAGYEQKLIKHMEKAKAGIHQCDGSAIYEGATATTGEWKSIKNTDIFARVWHTVKTGGEYADYKWTVKVDADAVFFPDRLRTKLQMYVKPPVGAAVYFHNIDFKFDFMGALEVMSKQAVDKLINGIDSCLKHIGADGGEDIFTMQCLDALHVGHMDDFSLLKDKYSNPGHFNLFDVDMCDDPTIAAFHPFKAVNSWMGCYKVAMGIVGKDQFTSCKHRWEGEACSLSSTLDHPGNHPEPGSGIVV